MPNWPYTQDRSHYLPPAKSEWMLRSWRQTCEISFNTYFYENLFRIISHISKQPESFSSGPRSEPNPWHTSGGEDPLITETSFYFLSLQTCLHSCISALPVHSLWFHYKFSDSANLMHTIFAIPHRWRWWMLLIINVNSISCFQTSSSRCNSVKCEERKQAELSTTTRYLITVNIWMVHCRNDSSSECSSSHENKCFRLHRESFCSNLSSYSACALCTSVQTIYVLNLFSMEIFKNLRLVFWMLPTQWIVAMFDSFVIVFIDWSTTYISYRKRKISSIL